MASSSKAVYAAIAADIAVAVAKFVAAGFTHSSSMASEGVHSLIDSSNGFLLLWGRRAGRRPADDAHPFGYGKEVYFWTLIVAVLIFAMGGGITFYEGLQHLLHPHAVEHPGWSYAVLAIAAVFDGYSWVTAYRQLRAASRESSIMEAARASKDPANFAVLFEDSAALLGVVVAFLGVFLSRWLNNPIPDGVASIGIGFILAAVALMLAYESKKLLVGEGIDGEAVASIRALAESDPAVSRVGQLLTMHLGPEEVLLNLDVQFDDTLSAAEIGKAVDRLEQAIHDKHAEIQRIFIEAEHLTGSHRARNGHGPSR